ncbi:MAG: GNAT family N-acetyltransferase [Pseudomonadota bacterium]|nr:GNAT family N-acetyltransferase [Pseudomonadota bacterium]
MKIVPITDKDWECLKMIRLESLLDSPDAFGMTYKEAKELPDEQWKSIAAAESGVKFFIARSHGEDIGLVGGVYNVGECELVSMWVKPEKRNHGIGGNLVKKLLWHAESSGVTSIVLKVSSKNLEAINLYSKMGFKALVQESVASGDSGVKLKTMVWCSAYGH